MSFIKAQSFYVVLHHVQIVGFDLPNRGVRRRSLSPVAVCRAPFAGFRVPGRVQVLEPIVQPVFVNMIYTLKSIK